VTEFIYRCPNTNLNVQGSDEKAEESETYYVAQSCPACAQIHIVSPRTGKLMAEAVRRPKKT